MAGRCLQSATFVKPGGYGDALGPSVEYPQARDGAFLGRCGALANFFLHLLGLTPDLDRFYRVRISEE